MSVVPGENFRMLWHRPHGPSRSDSEGALETEEGTRGEEGALGLGFGDSFWTGVAAAGADVGDWVVPVTSEDPQWQAISECSLTRDSLHKNIALVFEEVFDKG
jgi:hypothetical protein